MAVRTPPPSLTFDPSAPRRTLGLMMAILALALLLGLFPMVPGVLVLLTDLSGHVIVPDSTSFWLPTVFGLLTIGAAVLAWIGRPAMTRQLLLLVGALTLGVDLVVNSRATLMVNEGKFFGSTLDSGIGALSLCLIAFQILAYVFALWYLNRAPARAFYRRYTAAKTIRLR